jgi:hypothetical protein
MSCDCIPARSDGHSSQYSPGPGDLVATCVSYFTCSEQSCLESCISITVVWWRFPYQRAEGRHRSATVFANWCPWITTVPVAEEPEVFGFLCRHGHAVGLRKLSRLRFDEMEHRQSINSMAQEWRLLIAGPMDPLEVTVLDQTALYSNITFKCIHIITTLQSIRWY